MLVVHVQIANNILVLWRACCIQGVVGHPELATKIVYVFEKAPIEAAAFTLQ